MKIYRHGEKLVVITDIDEDKNGTSIGFREYCNGKLGSTRFYFFLFPKESFEEQFVYVGEGANLTKEYKTDFDCKQKQFESGAFRSDATGKGRFDLIPHGPLHRVAKVYERGAEKHGERNWEEGFPTSRGIDSAIRHIYQHTYGMDDEDHLAQAIWNLLAVMHFEMQIDEGRLPRKLDTLPKHYAQDDLDEYIESRSQQSLDFKNAYSKRTSLNSEDFYFEDEEEIFKPEDVPTEDEMQHALEEEKNIPILMPRNKK